MKIPTKLSSKLREVFPPKNLLPLLFSYTVDHIALSTYWIFFAIWLSEKLTDSYMIISIVIAIPAVISVFGTAVFSSFSDKTGRRKELILFSRIALMTQYLFLIFFQNSVWIVLVILACFGLFTQIFYVMNSTLLTIICHPDRRGQVSSFQSVFASAGWMIGSFISGFIYENLGIIGCLSFAAGFAILSGIIAMFSPIKPSYDKEEDKISSISNPAVEFPQTDKIIVAERTSKTSYWDIFKRPQVLTLILTLAILEFGYGPFNVITSVYLKDIGLTDSMISINNTVATFIGMVTLLLIGKLLDQKGRKPFLLIGLTLYPLIYGLMWIFDDYPWIIFAIYSVPLYAIKVPTANAIMSDLTSEKERARGMSLITLEQTITMNSGVILFCYVADIAQQGIRIIPLFPVTFGIVAIIIALFFIKETNQKHLSFQKLKRETKTTAIEGLEHSD